MLNNILKHIRAYFKEIDTPLLVAIAGISIFSIFNLYAILGPDTLFYKHIIFVIVGLSLTVVFSLINYFYLKNYTLVVMVAYIVSLILLSLTFYSKSVRGVTSWIFLGQFTFEPSELAKIVLIIVMAKFFSQRHVHIFQIREIIISGIYFAIPFLIIMAQPDLGSGIIFIAIWMGMLIAAGINKKHFAAIVLLGVICASLAWFFVLKPYQQERIVSFLNPYNDPRGSGYNLIQSQVAIGSGFWFGKGYGNGPQANLGFLPEPHNDFVFASIAEQFGFIGIITILGVLFFIISRILRIGTISNSNFGKLFSIGMAIFIFSHIFIGAGVNLGFLPVTGIPTSFLSYGGSHYISIMIGIGILQSIKRFG
jgi:rod shape determining protein RodA